ncbi:SIMPL domain-containing protein [Dokdonia sp. Dokd-P16]|uniref:SIMPL domain-containing protein n=1 Tax=Dokdonia sp. Dokd-P16 TaxID=2173169 RepID=UPI000D548A18|nr:SIMPL domain-containing protein [Dokdonia sp. Dokd-P16]AWH75101.1 SIMPL domain-containing protein [Dokdonia sp. Dokd-P16]
MKYLTAILLFTVMSLTAQTNTMEPLVNVTGEGIVKVIPDGVSIKVRVETQGKEAQQVKAENDQSIDKVIKFLRSQGIDSKYVQTEYINLNKNYDYNSKTYNYNANQTLTIQLKDIKMYEGVMTGLLNSGINRIDNVQFTSSKMDALKADARIEAIKDAKDKATAYAEALGQTIGKAVQISEQGTSSPQPPMYKARMMSMEMDNAGGETIAPGELMIITKIAVSFKLN